MSDKLNVEKQKAVSSVKREWLINSGLVLLYTLFMSGCFLIGFAHRYLADMQKWSNISVFLIILSSLCMGYVLYDLKRTMVIFSLCSFSGFALISITSVALFFHSYTSYSYRTGTDEFDFRITSPAVLIMVFVIEVLFINILGAIAGYYIAERTRKREKKLTLRCANCGTWNEQDATHCSYCGTGLKNQGTLHTLK